MKLNFEICKKCDSVIRVFNNYRGVFYFNCDTTGFILNSNEYKSESLDFAILLKNITEEEDWNDIKKMNVVLCDEKEFNNCPYYFEHLVEN